MDQDYIKRKFKFELVVRNKIKNVRLNIDPEHSCFLYNFYQSGINKVTLTNWFEGKIIDIYEFRGRFGTTKTCPWCKAKLTKLHLKSHNKTEDDLISFKLSNKLYQLLLYYLRNDHYDALAFLVKRECTYCINPNVKNREGKCAIPESSRNKPRSLSLLNFKCNGLDINKLSRNSVAIIYKRRPKRRAL